MRWSKQAAILIAGLVLTGCGHAASTSPSLPSRGLGAVHSPYPGNQTSAMPMSGAAAPGLAGTPAAQGAALLQMMRQNYARCTGVSADIKSYSQGHYKMGEKVTELRSGTTEAKMTWAKPNKLRLTVVTTTNPLLEGAALATPDGVQITARAAGLLSIFPFHFAPSDPKLRNNRNHPFTENNPKSQIERLTGPTAVWTVVADGMVENTPVKMISVDGVRHLDSEINREVVAVDPVAGTLRAVVMYNNATRLVDYHFMAFSWNPKTTDDMFHL